MSPMCRESEPPSNTTHGDDKGLLPHQLHPADMARATKELGSEPRSLYANPQLT